VAIELWCECCLGEYELCLSQHKGNTFLEWRKSRRSFRPQQQL
jgi:hypothetical protein